MNKHLSFISAIALMTAAAMPVVVNANENIKAVVHDVRGNVVLDERGNCVHTKWDANANDCGGQVVKVAKAQDKLASVYFDFNSSKLTKQAKITLNKLLKTLQNKHIEAVTIAGFADAVGSDSYNLRLSEKRAQAVQSYLKANGFHHSNTDMRALGKSEASTKCKALKGEKLHACMQEDRRVDIELSVVK